MTRPVLQEMRKEVLEAEMKTLISDQKNHINVHNTLVQMKNLY